jgi:hypothetical protein
MAVALSFWAANRVYSITFSARVLIGLCFAFATLWKLLIPEFLDGTFFHFTFLTDERFFGFSELIAGVTSDSRAMNMESYRLLNNSASREEFVYLTGTSIIPPLSIFMAYWTVLLEGWIAIAFLSPAGSKISKWRDIPLFIFMLTTYPIATVRGFATLLAVLGFAQCYKENEHMRVIYLAVFILVPLFSLPFERVLIELLSFIK